MTIPYDYYKVFYFVAKNKSITKAAKALSNSQPNITRIINNIEKAMNCKLFIRSSKGVTLTEQGEALYYYVKSAFQQFTLGEAAVESINNSDNRSVSIGIAVGITNNRFNSLLRKPISAFHLANPDIKLKIINAPSPVLLANMREGLLDLAVITTSSSDINETNSGNVIYAFEDIIIAGNAYRDEFIGPISLTDLVKYPLVGPGKHIETYEVYNRFFAEKGATFHINIETTSPEQAISFVIDNLGIGCLSPDYVEPAISKGQLIKVDLIDRLPKRYVSVIINEAIANPSAVKLEDYILKSN